MISLPIIAEAALCGYTFIEVKTTMKNNAAQRIGETILVLVLRISGIILMTALVPAVMPFAWMQEIHRWIGMGELPNEPIVGYLARSLSLMYAMHGALIFFVSLDIQRLLPVARFLAILGLAFGVAMIFLDLAVGMPAYWVLGEGPFIIPLSAVILWLSYRVTKQL
jgi:hypothetical protein